MMLLVLNNRILTVPTQKDIPLWVLVVLLCSMEGTEILNFKAPSTSIKTNIIPASL